MKELEQLQSDIAEIRRLLEVGPERPDDLVDIHYIAARTGLSPRTVADGKAGTNAIPRVDLSAATTNSNKKSRSLIRFPRYAADQWIRELCKKAVSQTSAARALKLVKRPKRRTA